MYRQTLLLLFLYGIRSSTGRPQTEVTEAREEIQRDRIKEESDVGANGSPGNVVFGGDFRNPVVEYLLRKGGARRKDVLLEIRHGQTLTAPREPIFAGLTVPVPERRPLKNADSNTKEVPEKFVTSPVLQLNRTGEPGQWTKTEMFAATGFIVSTYNADGSLKNSKMFFRPSSIPGVSSIHYGTSGAESTPSGRINWPLAGYFPVVINDPFLAAYNGITSGMYNTFSQMIEYGPAADICRKDKPSSKAVDEVTLGADLEIVKPKSKIENRRKRDTTGITVNYKNGDRVNVEVEEPKSGFRKGLGHAELVLRKGGIAIAGPGGAATAYTGGTAIVGPYGTVYKSPEGTAIVGPYTKVVNITDDMTFEDILRLHRDQIAPPNRRTRKFKTYKNYFSYMTDLPVSIEATRRSEQLPPLSVTDLIKSARDENAEEYSKLKSRGNETMLVFRPKARAEAGRKGVALSVPISRAVIYPNQKVRIRFDPESVAFAGPGGFAHAHSDLFLSYLRRRNVFLPAEGEERTRAHSVMLVNPPPLSSIARPSNTGFNIKKKGSKPSKPDSESGSEEVGEEVEDTTNQAGATDGVAISPPPDGSSVAEAKPVGLAIAGPGGVAAAKPQGTAVAGPGGLAIARPVGTAIAGVEVEGTVPIGGQQKNKKKKPKQDPEKMDDETETELHYVGGLTGPIGNPQPNLKDFGKASSIKSRSQENLLFQGKFNNDGFQLKLGEQDGKYGFVPLMVSPLKGNDRIQKRMDTPTFFHGLLGSRNIPPQGFQSQQIYPNFYY